MDIRMNQSTKTQNLREKERGEKRESKREGERERNKNMREGQGGSKK